MSDWTPMDEVPSWMAPEKRREFWAGISQVNIMDAVWRPRDEFDEGLPPDSLRGKVLALTDELDRLTTGLAGIDAEEAAQDLADGAALRRLREALPEAGHLVLLSMRSPARPWAIHAYLAEEIPATVSRSGDTIAEAARKCREALR